MKKTVSALLALALILSVSNPAQAWCHRCRGYSYPYYSYPMAPMPMGPVAPVGGGFGFNMSMQGDPTLLMVLLPVLQRALGVTADVTRDPVLGGISSALDRIRPEALVREMTNNPAMAKMLTDAMKAALDQVEAQKQGRRPGMSSSSPIRLNPSPKTEKSFADVDRMLAQLAHQHDNEKPTILVNAANPEVEINRLLDKFAARQLARQAESGISLAASSK